MWRFSKIVKNCNIIPPYCTYTTQAPFNLLKYVKRLIDLNKLLIPKAAPHIKVKITRIKWSYNRGMGSCGQ